MNELNKTGGGRVYHAQSSPSRKRRQRGLQTPAWPRAFLWISTFASLPPKPHINHLTLKLSKTVHRPPATSGTDTPPILLLGLGSDSASSFWPPASPQPPRSSRPAAPEDAPENELAESGPWCCRGTGLPSLGLRGSGCPGSPRRGGEGGGGGWAQQESLRGRRKLAGRRKSSGRGRRLQGPGEPQWRNRAQRRPGNGWALRSGSRQQNSAPVTSPPPYVPPRDGGAAVRNSGRSAPRESLTAATPWINRGIEGTTFLLLITFPSCLLFLPSTTFFCILPHHATRGDQRHFRGRFRSHPRTSGCTWRWSGKVGWLLPECRAFWGSAASPGNEVAVGLPWGIVVLLPSPAPCLFKSSPFRRGRGTGRWDQPPALSVTQGNASPAERAWQ